MCAVDVGTAISELGTFWMCEFRMDVEFELRHNGHLYSFVERHVDGVVEVCCFAKYREVCDIAMFVDRKEARFESPTFVDGEESSRQKARNQKLSQTLKNGSI